MLSISELARRTGTTTATLRFYERRGLLAPSGRTGRVRVYDDEALDRVATVSLLQRAGFTLAEIAKLLRPGYTSGQSAQRRQWTDAARAKLAELDLAQASIDRARTMLRHALTCPHPDIAACPVFLSEVRAHAARMGAPG